MLLLVPLSAKRAEAESDFPVDADALRFAVDAHESGNDDPLH